jgi:hypothetical protein
MNRAGASNYFKNHRESIIESVQEDERARESFKSKLEDINNKGNEGLAFWEPISGGGKGKGKQKQKPKTKNNPVNNALANYEPQSF